MQIRGAIYHHKNLQFHNGFTGNKYLVLLNSPGKNEPYMTVKTTSQKKKINLKNPVVWKKTSYSLYLVVKLFSLMILGFNFMKTIE